MTMPIFRPRARLLLQLGDQLIKNESIALLELVKNAYDADASNVHVRMQKLGTPLGEITIRDDGQGMTSSIIRNVWLEPGSDYKAKLLARLTKRKKDTHRLPLGEKGIGRFSVHKLGDVLELTTRMHGRKEVVLNIDWSPCGRACKNEGLALGDLDWNIPDILRPTECSAQFAGVPRFTSRKP